MICIILELKKETENKKKKNMAMFIMLYPIISLG